MADTPWMQRSPGIASNQAAIFDSQLIVSICMKPGETEADCVRVTRDQVARVPFPASQVWGYTPTLFSAGRYTAKTILIRQGADRLLDPENQGVNLSEELYGSETW